MEITTTNLADFGARELTELAELLQAMATSGLPDAFNPRSVGFMFNRNSGYVFLINEDYQVVMLNDGRLEEFHTLSGGDEGFLVDLLNEPADHYTADDAEYLRHHAELQGIELPITWKELPTT